MTRRTRRADGSARPAGRSSTASRSSSSRSPWARSLYGALGGFRSNEQLARDPAGLPDPWVFAQLHRAS